MTNTSFKNAANFNILGDNTNKSQLPARRNKKLTKSSKCLLQFGPKPPVFHLLLTNINIEIHRTIILIADLYWHDTKSVMLREEHRLRVFKNRVQREIFGAKWEGITGDSRMRSIHD
jgi:hypothetical protein